jgi:hypothetical protein
MFLLSEPVVLTSDSEPGTVLKHGVAGYETSEAGGMNFVLAVFCDAALPHSCCIRLAAACILTLRQIHRDGKCEVTQERFLLPTPYNIDN